MEPKKIIKYNGEFELFDPEKLKISLLRAKTNVILANDIVDKIQSEIKDGDTSDSVYRKAFALLKKKEKRSAAMYSIRRSILELGPSGFPFEKFVADILEKKGYKTINNMTLQGHCVTHETDVIAYDKDDFIVMEVKFHNNLAVKSDTKVAMYVKARFDDLRDQVFEIDGEKRKMTRGMLVTNTKFTNNAKKYATCVNQFDLISWEYPEKGNLYDLIYETGLQPTTCIPLLTKQEKKALIEKGFISCKSLSGQSVAMKDAGITDDKIKRVISNIDMICSI